jgi:hypothetical protein
MPGSAVTTMFSASVTVPRRLTLGSSWTSQPCVPADVPDRQIARFDDRGVDLAHVGSAAP